MLVGLHSEEVIIIFTQLCQTVQDRGFSGVLKSYDANDEEVRVISEKFRNTVAKYMILVNKFKCLSQFRLFFRLLTRIRTEFNFIEMNNWYLLT